MTGADGDRGGGRSAAYPVLAVAVVVGVLLATVTTVALLRARHETSPEVTAPSGPGATTTATSTRSSRATTSAPATDTSVVPAPAAVCDAGVINTDLGYPDSGARIIDCDAGWAVMASDISGDPFWVVFQNGRWRQADGVSIYTMTCPDEAIAMGAPVWMARRHLITCRTSMTSAVVPTARATTTRGAAPPLTTIRTTAAPPPATTTRAQTSVPTSMTATSPAPTGAPSDTSTATGGQATAGTATAPQPTGRADGAR
ncbi:cytoskeletal protein RodZ [Dietzia sp. 2505]|uniref:hypothetical protein n=1 Tax=Dietzia sp. 2505 TaxID=3156457 RepID=UPI00339AE29B